MGTFFLREEGEKPIVMVASGTGFAPIKAMLEQIAGLVRSKGFDRRMTLYWGGRRPHDLYMDELCRAWAADLPGFAYVPVVSDALPEDRWDGRTGFVHQAVMTDFPDLSGHQVYACGAPIVVDASRRDFIGECGLPTEEFYADAFVTAADVAATQEGP